MGDGVWRLRRVPRATVIEVSKIEESGHGNILSEDFLASRARLAAAGLTSEESDSKNPSCTTNGIPIP